MFSIFKRNRDKINREQTDAGVKRSRDGWFGRIRGLFASAQLDDAIWDELEEILISADVSVETTMNVLDELRGDVRAGRVADGEQAFQRLKELLSSELASENDADAWSDDETLDPPYVILVCGVNGVGKTRNLPTPSTSISTSPSPEKGPRPRCAPIWRNATPTPSLTSTQASTP